jgi:hypothetical protein
MSDLPRHAVTRTARLARLPVGFAGRTALGTGKRLGGRPAELVTQEIQQRTADQVFRVLGELKGGAMKFGQALSVFEAALPPKIAEPYRATLTRLQESAPPSLPPKRLSPPPTPATRTSASHAWSPSAASRPSSAGCYGSCTKMATPQSSRTNSGRTAISGTASALT